MHALSLIVGFLTAAIIAPSALRWMTRAGHIRENYRGRALPFPFGVTILSASLIALAPLALLQQLLSSHDVLYAAELRRSGLYIVGVALLGLIDDTLGGSGGGSEDARGWRGHARAVRRGELSTGALKAVGSLGLALLALDGVPWSTWHYLLAVAVLLLATNLLNLLDLRPGRAIKALVLLGAGLTIGSGEPRTLWLLGLFVGPALVVGVYDLRERAMLGDTGANLLGALAGWWLVLTLGFTGQAIALALLLAITVFAEFYSLSALLERTPGLRRLDSLGRPS